MTNRSCCLSTLRVLLLVAITGCEARGIADIHPVDREISSYTSTTRRVDIDADEWIIYDIYTARGAYDDLLPGPFLPCSPYPETLHIPKQQATCVAQTGALFALVRADLEFRASLDNVGPATFSVEVGKRQRISTDETWHVYYAPVHAYHMKKIGDDVYMIATSSATVEFAHLTGWVADPEDCHDQGGS